MSEKLEMKIYEKLGIKTFRKMAFILRDSVISFLSFKMPKEKRKELLYKRRSNYNIGKIESVEDLQSFKKYLYFNAFLHICNLCLCLNILKGVRTISNAIICSLFIVLDAYCIMLQRYNYIRINNVINKMMPKYEKQKNECARELKKEDELLLDHKYVIVDKKGNEEVITFDDLIKKSSLEDLKKYRDYLVMTRMMSYKDDSVNISVKRNKTLKLEMKNNRSVV